jgi:Bacterial DNA-binding protein
MPLNVTIRIRSRTRASRMRDGCVFLRDARGQVNWLRVIKSDIINAVAQTAGVPRLKATQAVETIIDALRQALSRGQRIELRAGPPRPRTHPRPRPDPA